MQSDQNIQAKVAALREKQSRWMREREAELERQQVYEDLSFTGAVSDRIQGSWNEAPTRPAVVQSSNMVNIAPEQVIDKLTERITDRLRSELRIELQKESQGLAAQAAVQAAQQDAFLAKELENQNTCPICYELMVPPNRAPQLLFPCGHTFCTSCAGNHIDKHGRNHCPVCRKKIDSRAINYPLQQLIINWVARRNAGSSSATCGPGGSLGSGTEASQHFSTGNRDDAAASGHDELRRKCERVGLRLRVLKNELLDIMAEQKALDSRKHAAAAVTCHLQDAEQQALAKLRAAQAELDMVKQQQEDQAGRTAALEDQVERLATTRSLLLATISPLEEEEEKLQMLLSGLQESQGIA